MGFLSFHRVALVLGAILFSAGVCLAAKEFVMPAPQAAARYPASEQHEDEGITIAIDPYDRADKAGIFTLSYEDADLAPIFLVVTNDGDQPVSLGGMKVQLITSARTKLAPATADDIYRRFARPKASINPYPFPRSKVKGGLKREQSDELERSQFSAKAVEPHSTQAGFVFFDVSGISAPLRGARFFLSGIQNAKGGELLYFEIPLEKYLSAPQPAKAP